MTRATLLDLADRCERATGPDRSIDCWIENGLGLARFVPDRPAPRGGGWLDKRVEPKPYTASLDAAMELVPEGHLWTMDSWSSFGWSAGIWRNRSWLVSTDKNRQSRSPALALASAALRARASMENPA